jgi:hypothetical protein
MAHLSDRIAATSSSQKNTKENVRELSLLFPQLHWVLRDFTLDLVDESGSRTITEGGEERS